MKINFNIKCSRSLNNKSMKRPFITRNMQMRGMILFDFIDKFLSPELRSLVQPCAAEFQSATPLF